MEPFLCKFRHCRSMMCVTELGLHMYCMSLTWGYFVSSNGKTVLRVWYKNASKKECQKVTIESSKKQNKKLHIKKWHCFLFTGLVQRATCRCAGWPFPWASSPMQHRRGERGTRETVTPNSGSTTELGSRSNGRCRRRGGSQQDECKKHCYGFCSQHDSGKQHKTTHLIQLVLFCIYKAMICCDTNTSSTRRKTRHFLPIHRELLISCTNELVLIFCVECGKLGCTVHIQEPIHPRGKVKYFGPKIVPNYLQNYDMLIPEKDPRFRFRRHVLPISCTHGTDFDFWFFPRLERRDRFLTILFLLVKVHLETICNEFSLCKL